jgi:hypothetical protein
MKNKTYIVEADRTLYFVEATSIVAAAAEILNVEKPVVQFRNNRAFQTKKYTRSNRALGPIDSCKVYISIEEIEEHDFTDRTIPAWKSGSLSFPERFYQGFGVAA